MNKTSATSILFLLLVLFISNKGLTQRYGLIEKTVDVKEAPEKKAHIIGQIHKGDKVPLLDEGSGHFKISTEHGEGYIKYGQVYKIEYGTVEKADLSSYNAIYIESFNEGWEELNLYLDDMIRETRLKLLNEKEFSALGEEEKCAVLSAIPNIRYPDVFDLDPQVKFTFRILDCNFEDLAVYNKKRWANTFDSNQEKKMISKVIKEFRKDL